MELNKNYRIIYDSENTILQFYENKEIFKKEDKLKIKGTGEIKEFTENYYYPNLKSALKGFLNKCNWNIKTAEQILKKLNEIEQIINKI